MWIIRQSSHFERKFRKLPEKLQIKIRKCSKVFAVDPFDPSFKTHKLHGERKNEWAYSIDFSLRITFIFVAKNEMLYTDVGTHDQVY